jgi:hypothetical protein
MRGCRDWSVSWWNRLGDGYISVPEHPALLPRNRLRASCELFTRTTIVVFSRVVCSLCGQLLPCPLMSRNDLERAVFHPRPSPITPRNGHSSLPAVSLSHEHILEALQRSPDNGATLDLAHKHLADVSETAAEELFTLGKNKPPESKSVPLAR